MNALIQSRQPLTHAEELLARMRAKENIYEYIQFMKDSGLPEFQHTPADHHRLILDFAQKMADGEGEIDDRMLCSMPPGSAKTTWLAVVVITWLMARDPSTLILAVVNSDALSERNSRARRLIMQSREWQAVSESSLAPDAQSLAFLGTIHGGYIKSAAAQGVVTGFRAHWLIVDDIIGSFQEAQSQTRLNKIWDWYITEAKTRLVPGGKEMIIGTRWAQRDLIGRLLQRHEAGDEQWKYFRVPMVCDDTDDPLGRKLGDRLWPTWFTQRMVDEARRSPLLWRTLHQCQPFDDEGLWMPADKFVVETSAPGELKHLIGIDLATGLTRGDYTVIMVAGIDARGDVHFIDCFRGQVTTDVAADHLIRLVKKYTPTACVVDNDLLAKAWGGILTQKQREANVHLPMETMKIGNKAKDERAASLRGYLNMDKVKFVQAEWTDAIFSEFLAFPGGKNDDSVDAAALIVRYLPKISAPKEKGPAEAPRTAFQIGPGGMISTSQMLDDLFADNENKHTKHAYERMRI